MAARELKWESNKNKDDFTCNHNGYTFRIEKLDTSKWWYQIYKNDKELFLDNNICTSKNYALGLCAGFIISDTL